MEITFLKVILNETRKDRIRNTNIWLEQDETRKDIQKIRLRWFVPLHTGHAGLHKQWPRFHEHHNHWWRVLGVRVRPGTRHFPYNENPTRALNTTSLKWCLPSIDAIDRREKFTHSYEVSRSPHTIALHWNPPVFRKKAQIQFYLISTFRCAIF